MPVCFILTVISSYSESKGPWRIDRLKYAITLVVLQWYFIVALLLLINQRDTF